MPSAVREATTAPCKACPWRISNQGKRTPGGWYSRKNLDRLWAGMRRGEKMTCHPTDPRMSDVVDEGYSDFRPAPEGAETRECAGALIVAQREMMVLQQEFASDVRLYRRGRPKGLTREGILSVVSRAMFGGTILGGLPMAKPNLNEPDVGHPALPWELR